MSDMELPQQPTFLESGETQSKLLGDEEIRSFIKNKEQDAPIFKQSKGVGGGGYLKT